MEKLPNLYSLRFFLALMVVVFHIPVTSIGLGLPYFNGWPVFNKGLVAVNFFFTLSGFLIVRQFYLRYRISGTVDLGRFYMRRIRRLWPVYYLVLILGLILYHLILPLAGIDYQIRYDLPELVACYALLAPNVFTAQYPVGGILNVLWSVGVEEQFYLVFPLLFLVFRKRIKMLLAVLLFLFVGLMVFYLEFYQFRNFYFYFAWGGLCSVLAEEGKLNFLRFGLINTAILALFVVIFFTDWLLFADDFVRYHLLNLIVSGLFIAAVAYFPLFDLDRTKAAYFGKISYGIYMYHMFVVTSVLYASRYFGMERLVSDTAFILLANLAVVVPTLAVSHFSYRYFEKRFLQTGKKNAPLS